MNLLTEKITKSIISANAYIGCKEVLHFEEIATIEYSAKTEEALLQVLRTGDYEKIALFQRAKDLLGEELTVIKFSDGKGKQHYGVYYDSIELWQDPAIISIVPCVS